jgi:hypothetical protein
LKKAAFAAIVAPLALAAVAVAQPANAAGCLKGAVIGGTVGHFAGHHGVLGAGVGCAIGHHEAAKHEREREREAYYRHHW